MKRSALISVPKKGAWAAAAGESGGDGVTLEELEKSNKAFLTPGEISGILGSNPQTIRVTARQRPDMLGFEFTFIGNRMKIPRIPFLRFMGMEVQG